jgi:DNA-binding transcriptional regulator YiaG
MSIATELAAKRQELRLTQEAMALRIGVPVQTYRHWEYGERQPRGLALRAVQKFIISPGRPGKGRKRSRTKQHPPP